jgi:acyl-CoA thioester hydrolase
MTSTITYRICYEDTDAGGVVYYGNYLRYLERGRNEYLRDLGMGVKELHDEGIFFIVVNVNLDYRKPAVYDDLVTVRTEIKEYTRASVTFGQKVLGSEGEVMVEGAVRVACVGNNLRPRRLPPELVKRLEEKGA